MYEIFRILQALPRLAVAVLGHILSVLVGMGVGYLVFGNTMVAEILGAVLFLVTISSFWVSVPEVTGLVTVNIATGDMVTYDTGLHPRYPWEQVKIGNYINLRLITVRKEETYPSEDGPLMHVKWSYQYRAAIKNLPKYLSVDENTIQDGLSDVGSSFLSHEIFSRTAEMGKKDEHQIEDGLVRQFADPHAHAGNGPKGESYEDLYGIKLVKVALADIDFDKRVQHVRSTSAIIDMVKKMAASIRKEHPDVSQKDAMNIAMIINGDITKSVTEVEGQGGQALAALLIAAAKAAGGSKEGPSQSKGGK